MEDELHREVREHACWERGSDRAWECDAIVGAKFLAKLTALASKAPAEDQRAFIKWAQQ
jgi:hypothetical protein